MGSAFLITPMQITSSVSQVNATRIASFPQPLFQIRNGAVISATVAIPLNSTGTGFIGVTFTSANLSNLNSELSAINTMERSAIESRISQLSRELGINSPTPSNLDQAKNLAKSLISQYWYLQNQNRLTEAYSNNLGSPSFSFTPFAFGASLGVSAPSPSVQAVPVRSHPQLTLLRGSSSDVVSRLEAGGMFWHSVVSGGLFTSDEIGALTTILGRIDQRRDSLTDDQVESLNRVLGNGTSLLDAISSDLPRNYSTSRPLNFTRTSFARLVTEIYTISSSLFSPNEQPQIRAALTSLTARTLSVSFPELQPPTASPVATPLSRSERANLERQIVDQNRANISSRTARNSLVSILVDLSQYSGFRSEFENDGAIINAIQAGPRDFVISLRDRVLPHLTIPEPQRRQLGGRITTLLSQLPASEPVETPTPPTPVTQRAYPTIVSEQTTSRLRAVYGSVLGSNFDSFILILRELYPLPNGVVSGYVEDSVDPQFHQNRLYPPFSQLSSYLIQVVNQRISDPQAKRRLLDSISALLHPAQSPVVAAPSPTLTSPTITSIRRTYAAALGNKLEDFVSLVQAVSTASGSDFISALNRMNFTTTDISRFFDILNQRISTLDQSAHSQLLPRLSAIQLHTSRIFNARESADLRALLSRTFNSQTLPSASMQELSAFLVTLSRERGFRVIVPNISVFEAQLNSGGFAALFNYISSSVISSVDVDSATRTRLTSDFTRIRTAIETRLNSAPAPVVTPNTPQISLTLSPSERAVFDLVQRGNPREILNRIQNHSLSLDETSSSRILLNIYQYAISHPDSLLNDILSNGLTAGDSLNDRNQSDRLAALRQALSSTNPDLSNLIELLHRLNIVPAAQGLATDAHFNQNMILAYAVLIWRDSHSNLTASPVGSWFETPRAPEIQVQLNPTQASVSTNVLSGNYSAVFAQRATLTDEILRPVAQDISNRFRDAANASETAAAYRAYLSTRGSRFVSNGRVTDPIEALRNFAAFIVLNPTDRYSADSRALLSALHPPPSTVRNLTNPQSNLFDLISSLAVMRWRDNNSNARNNPTPNFATELNPSAVVTAFPTAFARSAIDRDHQQILDDTFNGQQYRRILGARTSGFSDSTQNNVMVDVVYARLTGSTEQLPHTPRIAPASALRTSYSSLQLTAATTPLQKTEHLIRTIWEYARSGRNSGSELFCADAVALLQQIDSNSPLLQLFNRGTNPPSIAIIPDSQFASIAQSASLYQVFTLLSIAERRIRDRSTTFDYPTELAALGFARPVVAPVPTPTPPIATGVPTTEQILSSFRFSGRDPHQFGGNFDQNTFTQVPNLPATVSEQLGFVIGGDGTPNNPFILNVPVFDSPRPGSVAGAVIARTQSFAVPIGGVHVQLFYTYAGPNAQRPPTYPPGANSLAYEMILNLRRNRSINDTFLGRALNHDLSSALNSSENNLLDYLRSAHLTYARDTSPALSTSVFRPTGGPTPSTVQNPNSPILNRRAGTAQEPHIITIPLNVPRTLYPSLTELIIPAPNADPAFNAPPIRQGSNFFRVRYVFNRTTANFSSVDLRRDVALNPAIVGSYGLLPGNRGRANRDFQSDLTMILQAASVPEPMRRYVH